MSVYGSILKQWIIDPIQNSIVVPIFNQFTVQNLFLLPVILPIFNHFTTNPIKTLLLLLILLPIFNQWIIDPLQNYVTVPILNQLTTDRIQILPIFDLLTTHPIIAVIWKPIEDQLPKFLSNLLLKAVFDHLKFVFIPIKLHIGYLFKCDSYVGKLKKQTKKLKEKRENLEQSVIEADEITQWLSSANNEINEAEVLIQRNKEAKMKECFFGLCPNLKSRYQLSKEADEKASAIDRLRNQEGVDPFLSLLPLQQIVEPSVYSREALPSRVLLLNQVMSALKDPNLYMIGVYGLGGVGKTTLAKEVQKKAVEEKMFKRVILVPVSQTPDLRRIQGEIADFIGLKFDAQEVPGRASQLKKCLENSKVLIILDDIWTEFELKAVGIPLKDECKGSKLLLTSRSHDVLSLEMGTQKEFSLEVLGEGETWKLFQKTLEDANNPELKPIAIEVSKKCSGLPLLVNIVAADLKNKESYAWRDVLVKLSDLDNEDIQRKVHKVLKSSFENLPGTEAKSLFLLCSLFGQSNIPTNHLLTYVMGLGLFKNIVRVERGRDRLCGTIEKLKTESLLLDGDMDGHVKMHDVVLDFARSIATKDQHAFFGVTVNGLRKLWPVDKDCTRILLHHCDISEFPGGLEYPNAELLSLFTEDLNLVIPDLFFKGIRKLKVLNLTGMRLMPLPSSLQFLTNLHSLYLHGCQLDDVAIVGVLKQLEFLSFEKSHIVELPRQLGEVTQLKSLNLSDCSYLEVIPPNVLSKLTLLEELYIKSFNKWDMNGNASLMELEELKQLTTLEVRASDPEKIPNQLCSKRLERYRILVGIEDWDWRGKYETSRTLKLEMEDGLEGMFRGSGDLFLREVKGMEKTSIHLEDGLKELLRGTGDLFLRKFKGMENGLYDLNEEGFPNLKHLYIKDDKAIRHIIDSTMWVSCDAFPILETLNLYRLSSLEEICHGRCGTRSFRKLRTLRIIGCGNLKAIIGEGSEDGISNPRELSSEVQTEMVSFPNLTRLKVEQCKSLKYIFKTSTVKSLLQLERLEIKDCELMEEIILTEKFEAKEKIDKIVFSKLEFLELSRLPNLIRFSNGYPIEFQSLIEMNINVCQKLKNFISNNSNWGSNNVRSLFNKMAAFPNIQTIEMFEMDNLEYIWHGQFADDDDSLCKLKSLIIESCSKLKAIFAKSKNVMRRFQRLEELMLGECSKMEVIYQMEKLDGIDDLRLELKYLGINDMPSLKWIWSEDANGVFTFPNLESVKVRKCHDLEYVFPASIALELTYLEINSMQSLKRIWSEDANGVFTFPNLESVEVSDCRVLEYVFPASITSNLRYLKIKRMPSLKRIWSKDTNGVFTSPNLKLVEVFHCHDLEYVFPATIGFELEHLEVEYMPSLKRIWSDDANGVFTFPNLKSVQVCGCHVLESVVGNTNSGELCNFKCPKLECLQLMENSQKANQVLPQWGKVSPNLEILELKGNNWMKNVEVYGSLTLPCSLKKLVLKIVDLEELFLLEDERAVIRLECLELHYLGCLKYIWKEGFFVPSEYLKTLIVYDCQSLIKITASSISFQNLTTLHMSWCKKLENLVTPSTAKTMEHLVELKVEYCEMMTQIVADDSDDATEHEIIFKQLKSLELINLSNLNSFCSRNNCTFHFPSLGKLSIIGCKLMRIFTRRDSIPPKLQGVQTDKYIKKH